MKNCCISFILFLSSWFCIGQSQLFNYTYDVNVVDSWTDIVYYDDTIHLTGITTNSTSQYIQRLYSKIPLSNISTPNHFPYGELNNYEYYPGFGSSLLLDYEEQKVFLPGVRIDINTNISSAYYTTISGAGDSISSNVYMDTSDIQSAIYLQSEGKLVFTGTTVQYNPAPHLEMHLFKCDTSGTIIWSKTYGGNEDDYPYSLDRTHDGGYVMAGYTESWGAGGRDVYVVKTDSLGNLEWQKYFGDVNNDAGWVKALENGDILVYGGIQDPNSSKGKGFSRKLDSLGNTKWHEEYYYNLNEEDWFQSMTLASDGYVFIGASVDPSDNTPLGWVLKTDFNGNELWSRRYRKRDSQNYLRDIIELPNGDLMACGFVFPEAPLTQDAWLLRLNCLGFDSLPEAQGNITTMPDYEVQLENESINWGNCIINWGDGTSNYLYEDYSTQLSHAYPNGNTYDIELIALACDSSDTMHFQVTPTFTGLTENETLGTFSMYPNPTQNEVTVQYTLNNPMGKTNVSIYDLTGRKLKTKTMTQAQGSAQFSTVDYPNGVYLVVLSDDSGRHKTGKLVVRH